MASVDAKIDELYQGPLTDFVSARNALAKSLTGDASQQVKALKKPAAAAFAVNQLFWTARAMFERLVKAGAALRAAQVAELKGRKRDVRASIDSHRQALTAAVKEAQRLAAIHEVHPDQNALTQMLEAVSLAASLVEPPGRLTTLLQPAGFEALAGVAVKATPRAESGEHDAVRQKRVEAFERQRLQEAARAERERTAALRQAERSLEKAQASEARAREAWEDARAALEKAQQKLARARG